MSRRYCRWTSCGCCLIPCSELPLKLGILPADEEGAKGNGALIGVYGELIEGFPEFLDGGGGGSAGRSVRCKPCAWCCCCCSFWEGLELCCVPPELLWWLLTTAATWLLILIFWGNAGARGRFLACNGRCIFTFSKAPACWRSRSCSCK